MVNSHEIEIATIKDLKGIFFYYIDDVTDKRISGLSIVYGDKKKLDYNYTYKYFKEYVMKVLSVYQKEKDTRDIILYGKLTEEVVNSYDVSFIQISNDTEEYSNNKINLFGVNNIELKDIEGYLGNVVASIMEIITSGDKGTIKSIKGYLNKYLIEYVDSSGISSLVSLQCIKRTGSTYDFKMYFHDNRLLKSIDGYIEISDDNLLVIWDNYDKTLRGEYSYSLEDEGSKEIIYNDLDDILYLGDELDSLTDDDKNMLNTYSELVGIKCNKIIPTVMDSYIIGEVINNYVDESVFYKRKIGYTTVKSDYVSIIYFDTEGVIKYDGTLVIPFMKEQKEFRFIPIDVNDEHYILKEIVNVPTDKMSGEYQKISNKYCYYIMKVSQNSDLRMPMIIENEERISDDKLDNLTKVKKYMRTRKRV